MCSVSGAHALSVVGVSSNCFHRIDDIFNAVKMRHRLWGRLCRRSDVNSAAGYRCPRNFLSVILETFYSLVTKTFSSWRSRWKYEGKQSVIRFFKREVEQRGSNQIRCEKYFTPLWSKIQMFTVNASHCAADLSGFLNILCCSLKRNRRNSKVIVIAIAPMFLWSTRSRPPTLTNPLPLQFRRHFPSRVLHCLQDNLGDRVSGRCRRGASALRHASLREAGSAANARASASRCGKDLLLGNTFSLLTCRWTIGWVCRNVQ